MAIKPDLKKFEDGEIRDENKVYIVWSYEDVMSLCPNLSADDAVEALRQVGRGLNERSTEEGWEILECLLEMRGYKIGDKEEVNA
jgi:hypothetical protein